MQPMEKKLKISGKIEKCVIEAYKLGASDKEVCLETGVSYDDLLSWLATDDNCKLVEQLRFQPILDSKKTLANKVKSDEKTAQWYLSHHKDTKTEWSDRTEHTGADGKDLQVTLVKFIDNKDTDG